MSVIHRAITGRRLTTVAAVTALFVVPGSPVLVHASQGNPNGKQTICHRTDSNTNPYVINTPNKNGDLDGHLKHTGPLWTPTLKANHIKWGDIIPPFDYNNHGKPAHFAGLNWTTAGQAWFNNKCRVPITATIDKTNDADGDLTFTNDETTTTEGATVPFKVVITNTSVVPAVLSALTDAVSGSPLAFTCDTSIVGTTIPAGGSVLCNFSETNYSPADGGIKVNTVTATLHQVGNSGNGVTVSDTSTVRTIVPPPPTELPPPDVAVLKTGPASVAPGDTFAWTLTATNTGTVPAPSATIKDTLPAETTLVSAAGANWTCTGTTEITCVYGPDLDPGASSAVVVTVTLDAAFTGTEISNTAVITPEDTTPTDNTSTVVTPVIQPTGGGGGTTVPPPVTTPPATGGGGGVTTTPTTLPHTGAPVARMAADAAAMVLVGLGLMLLAPRRRELYVWDDDDTL